MVKENIIFSSDLHGQIENPVCRTDNYHEAFIKKLHFIDEQCKKHNAIHACTGDIVDKYVYRSASQIINTTGTLIENMPDDTIGIYGNHDLLNRSPGKYDSSIIRNVVGAGVYDIILDHKDLDNNVTLWGFNFGTPITHKKTDSSRINIALFHGLIVETDNSIFGGIYGLELLKKFPEYDMIITGDNHKTFTIEYEGRKLINCGSLMRMDADQADHKPVVFLYEPSKDAVTPIYVPVEEGVVSNEHLLKKKDKEERFEAVLSSIDSSYEMGFAFDKNAEAHIKKNKLDGEVAGKIRWAIDPDRRIAQ